MTVNRCPHCMEELGELNGNFCPFCGFNAAQNPQPPEALPRESILHGKYLIGDVLGRGGFGITYIGFDLSLESKVAIKEYYPSGSAMRREGESSLYWNSTCASQTSRQGAYDDFLKEARKMARVDSIPSIVRVRETFLENETAYIGLCRGRNAQDPAQAGRRADLFCMLCNASPDDGGSPESTSAGHHPP